ncbi:MAG: aspartate kinase [Candidatus Eutrophobiaceae bacterium]
MAIWVQKFGGTSVGSLERIEAVAKRVIAARQKSKDVVVVVSAMSGETNRLLQMAHQLSDMPVKRELDVLLSTGEQTAMALLCIALQKRGCGAVSLTGPQVSIRTDSAHGKARILEVEAARMRAILAKGKVVVVAGFQGISEAGDITTFGRGGSDTTAVALAAALQAEECLIYTDVDGVYTADPQIVPKAHHLAQLSYEEMLEMASLGSKVLQIRSVAFAWRHRIKVRVLSSFEEAGRSTLITEEENNMEQASISAIAHSSNEAKLTMLGVPDKPGIAYRILGSIAKANIEVDMIVQNVGEHNTTDFTFTVSRADYVQAMAILQQMQESLGAREVNGNQNIAKISVVGVGMRSHAGIASTMFKALADEGINIRMISTSEIKISVVVDEKYLELAVRTLHSIFGLDETAEHVE